MTDNNGLVTITFEEYNALLESQRWLECLEQAGVDNWDGYECALEIRDEYVEE